MRPTHRRLVPAIAIASAWSAGCASTNDHAADASTGSDAGPVACTVPLDDAGFSTLADLPLSQLCAEAASFGDGTVTQSAPCQGFTFVVLNDQADCWWLWVFDEATGSLIGDGASCNTSFACTVAQGVPFPSGCVNAAVTAGKNLCPNDGGAESG